RFAAHTNNVVNYCESHDEQSVPYELQFTPWLDNPAAKERKGRLGMFATLVALGQPMIYMGQEFHPEPPRILGPRRLAGHPGPARLLPVLPPAVPPAPPLPGPAPAWL